VAENEVTVLKAEVKVAEVQEQAGVKRVDAELQSQLQDAESNLNEFKTDQQTERARWAALPEATLENMLRQNLEQHDLIWKQVRDAAAKGDEGEVRYLLNEAMQNSDQQSNIRQRLQDTTHPEAAAERKENKPRDIHIPFEILRNEIKDLKEALSHVRGRGVVAALTELFEVKAELLDALETAAATQPQ
jgi:hypothetical protein